MTTRLVRRGAVLCGLALMAACGRAPSDRSAMARDPEFKADAIRAHIAFLADDTLRGRDSGSADYQIAANYVAAHFLELGLEPAGSDGYFQPVPLRSVSLVEEAARLSVRTAAGRRELTYKADFLMGGSASHARSTVSAPAVFVGFGIEAPARGHDDYAAVDLAGKVAVFLSGGPNDWPSDERAYFASSATKRATAAAHGAVAVLEIPTPTTDKVRTFEQQRVFAGQAGMSWIEKGGTTHSVAPGIQAAAVVNPSAATVLFEGSGLDLAAILAESDAASPAPAPLMTEVTLAQASRYEDVNSPNVAAILPGSDPGLADDVVIISAHLDHVGTGQEIEGDGIYNGALDNAAGVAVMLEVARAMAAAPERPRRSVMFLAVTAEEKGLLGAEYFAHHPTVPVERIVANVNLDMPVLTYDFSDVIAFGAEHSSLGPTVADAAGRAGVALIPDPMPQETIFTRSDHFRFVEKGIPAVFLATGWGMTPDGRDGGEAFRGFLATHYHKPSDDLSLPIDYAAGAKFANVNWRIIEAIANAEARPTWNEGDFFGDRFGNLTP